MIEVKASKVDVLASFGNVRLLVDVESDLAEEELNNLVSAKRPWRVSIKTWRNKRSLDSNAMLWALIGEIAKATQGDKDEIYLDMLQRYGVSTILTAETPQAAEMLTRAYKLCRVLGKVTINGKTGIQVLCFVGSSNYDTGEMATLIDGVIRECEELGIGVYPAEDIERAKREWGCGKKHNQ